MQQYSGVIACYPSCISHPQYRTEAVLDGSQLSNNEQSYKLAPSDVHIYS